MIIQTVTRTYSRSINTRTYGAPESWIKIEATYTGVCESGDDPAKVSQVLYEQAQKEVVASMGEIITKIRSAANPVVNGAGGSTVATAPVAPAPATPVAPSAPAYTPAPATPAMPAQPRAL